MNRRFNYVNLIYQTINPHIHKIYVTMWFKN
jgi:hypothetical protein